MYIWLLFSFYLLLLFVCVFGCRRPLRFEKKKKFKESFLLSSKREEKFYCVRVDGDAKRLDVKSLYTVSNTHTLYRAARLYYDVITFQFDVCVRLGYGNIFQKKKKITRIRNCCSFILYWARAMLLLFLSKIIIKRKKRKKKQKKHFSSVFLWNYIFLKKRVKTLAARIPRYE